MDNFNKDQMKNLEKFSNMSTSFMFRMVGWITKGMIFLSKNTKLIFGIILLIIFFKVGTYVVSIEPTGVYEITTSSGIVYNTNEIEVKDGCVYFKKMNTQEETIICGDCIIVKN
jgi:hypothetical protein